MEREKKKRIDFSEEKRNRTEILDEIQKPIHAIQVFDDELLFISNVLTRMIDGLNSTILQWRGTVCFFHSLTLEIFK